ncbi:MAG: hypothetical protein QM500_19815 [Methylococcales bacterium]
MNTVQRLAEWILYNEKKSLILFGGTILLIIIIVSGYEIKEMLYPSYESCEAVTNEIERLRKKNIPSFIYEHQTDQYNKLCK